MLQRRMNDGRYNTIGPKSGHQAAIQPPAPHRLRPYLALPAQRRRHEHPPQGRIQDIRRK